MEGLNRIIIEYSPADGVYVARVPALPGCTADGKTPEEAAREITVAIDGHIEARHNLGMPIPDEPGRST